VAEFESAGVGRPSTYANTLKTLVDRGLRAPRRARLRGDAAGACGVRAAAPPLSQGDRHGVHGPAHEAARRGGLGAGGDAPAARRLSRFLSRHPAGGGRVAVLALRGAVGGAARAGAAPRTAPPGPDTSGTPAALECAFGRLRAPVCRVLACRGVTVEAGRVRAGGREPESCDWPPAVRVCVRRRRCYRFMHAGARTYPLRWVAPMSTRLVEGVEQRGAVFGPDLFPAVGASVAARESHHRS